MSSQTLPHEKPIHPLEPQTAYYAAMLLNSRGMKEDYVRFLKAACSSDVSFPQKRAAKKELEALENTIKK